MKPLFSFLCIVFTVFVSFSQKDSLAIGDRYAEDQLYLNFSYSQLYNQPTNIAESGFSYAISTGFIKDITLNKQGNVSFAAGIGYGYNSFNHQLNVLENNSITYFKNNTTSSNSFSTHALEFPLELRWRTSTAKEYGFWRIYTGIKFLYNFSNNFEFTDNNNTSFSYKNVSSYNNFQYGLTLAAGYDAFNINVFYGLTPIFNSAYLGTEKIETKIIKIGLIFYIL